MAERQPGGTDENVTPAERLTMLRTGMTSLTLLLLDTANERAQTGLEIGAAKRESGITQVRDLDREREVLDFMVGYNKGPMNEDQVRRLGQLLMDISSELQAETTGLAMGDTTTKRVDEGLPLPELPAVEA